MTPAERSFILSLKIATSELLLAILDRCQAASPCDEPSLTYLSAGEMQSPQPAEQLVREQRRPTQERLLDARRGPRQRRPQGEHMLPDSRPFPGPVRQRDHG